MSETLSVRRATWARVAGRPIGDWSTLDRAFMAGHPTTPPFTLARITDWAVGTWQQATSMASSGHGLQVSADIAADTTAVLAANPRLPRPSAEQIITGSLWQVHAAILERPDITLSVLLDAWVREALGTFETAKFALLPAIGPISDAVQARAEQVRDDDWRRVWALGGSRPAVARVVAGYCRAVDVLEQVVCHPDVETRRRLAGNPDAPAEIAVLAALSV